MVIAYTSITLSFGIILLIVAWRVLNWVWLKPMKLEKKLRKQGLKGNPYRLLYGDMKDMIVMLKEAHSKPIGLCDDIVPRVIPLHRELVKKYGENIFIWFGPTPAVIIMDSELIREITQKIYQYPKPPFHPLGKLLVQGLVFVEGNKWAKHRKIITPAFHIEKLKLMIPAFYTSTAEMMDKWEENVSPKGSCEVDVCPDLHTLTCDGISRTAFGSDYQEGRKIFELQREQAEHFMKVLQSIDIPGWRFLPTKRNKRMKEISKTVEETIGDIINTRTKAMRAGKTSDSDLLDILLESNSKEINQHGNKDFGLSIKEVIDECKLFYFAGQETTAVLLTWTMIMLSRHPLWQTRAREEVLQQFGTNKPDFDGLNHLKIVTMVFYEVLRLYPPVAVLDRITTEETKLGNLSLPAGVKLLLPTIFLHHDPELWGDDVKEFKPQRFEEGISNATKGQFSFFPFSWGPRICIGQNFALLEAKMAMAMILQRFAFELSPSYAHAPCSIVTVQPQHGTPLILHKL